MAQKDKEQYGRSYAPDFPEKVYIPRDPEYPQSPNIWWERESSESNIEYTRTDTFVEKACSWLENNLQGIVGGSIYIEDFRKYMEGE